MKLKIAPLQMYDSKFVIRLGHAKFCLVGEAATWRLEELPVLRYMRHWANACEIEFEDGERKMYFLSPPVFSSALTDLTIKIMP